MPELDVTALQDDLDKGNLVGEEAEAARKAIEEAEEAKKKEGEEDEAKKKEDEESEAKKKEEEEEENEDKKKEEGEGDEEAKKAEEEAKAEIDKRIKIPKFRYDAANTRAKKAEAENEELRSELAKLKEQKPVESKAEQTPQEKHDAALADIDAQIAEAVKEGKADEISKLMAKSRSMEREFQFEQTAAKMDETTTMTREQVQESRMLDSILDQLETEFPIFNEASDEYAQEANDEVLRLQKAFISSGQRPSEALVEAVNFVIPKYYADYNSEKDKAEDKGKDKDEKKVDKKKDIDRNVDTAKKQAPDMDDAGEDSDTTGAKDDLPNAAELTDEEYDALPEETKKRMRGDNF